MCRKCLVIKLWNWPGCNRNDFQLKVFLHSKLKNNYHFRLYLQILQLDIFLPHLVDQTPNKLAEYQECIQLHIWILSSRCHCTARVFLNIFWINFYFDSSTLNIIFVASDPFWLEIFNFFQSRGIAIYLKDEFFWWNITNTRSEIISNKTMSRGERMIMIYQGGATEHFQVSRFWSLRYQYKPWPWTLSLFGLNKIFDSYSMSRVF